MLAISLREQVFCLASRCRLGHTLTVVEMNDAVFEAALIEKFELRADVV